MANFPRESDPLLFIAESADDSGQTRELTSTHRERMRPSVAGGLMGFVGGAAALGLVQALNAHAFSAPVLRAATAHGLEPRVSYAVAYVTAAAWGALIGGAFASLTRNLKKLVPLFLWAELFFVSLAMILVAAALTYAKTTAGFSPAVALGSTAVYAALIPFSLPLRLKR